MSNRTANLLTGLAALVIIVAGVVWSVSLSNYDPPRHPERGEFYVETVDVNGREIPCVAWEGYYGGLSCYWVTE